MTALYECLVIATYLVTVTYFSNRDLLRWSAFPDACLHFLIFYQRASEGACYRLSEESRSLFFHLINRINHLSVAIPHDRYRFIGKLDFFRFAGEAVSAFTQLLNGE